MRILDRYILREAIVYFLITLFAFTGILLTVRMLHFASLIINKGVQFNQIVSVFAAIIPTFLEIAIPMAALLGIMIAFARFSGDSEVIIFRASGISLYQLLRPILFFAVISGLISLYVSLYLRPWGNAKLAQTLFEIARSKSTAGLSAGIFNKLGTITLYADSIDDKSGDLERVLIDDKRDMVSRKLILAQTGRIISDDATRSIILQLNNGSIHEEHDGNYSITDFTSNNLLIDVDELYASGDSIREKKNKELFLSEIRPEIERLSTLHETFKSAEYVTERLPPEIQEMVLKNPEFNINDVKRKIRKLKIEAGMRFSMPYATFILAVLGLPLGIVPPRTQKTWGAGLSIILGLIVFTLYYVLLSLGITFGENGKISPGLGLWLPNLAASIVTAFIIYRMSTERWASIAHGLELWISRSVERLGKIKLRKTK